MKKNVLMMAIAMFSVMCMHGQKSPIIIESYDLSLSLDFSEQLSHGSCHAPEPLLQGSCQIKIHNLSDTTVNEIPFLLYRLMKAHEITNSTGENLPFVETVTQMEDYPTAQVNYTTVKTTILPHQSITIHMKYSGYLLGYTEIGWRYLKDRISPEFTLIRQDAYAYPYLCKPNLGYLRENIRNFDYTVKVTVPENLAVANTGILEKKENKGKHTTYYYKSKKPNWRIDVAIAPYKKIESYPLDIFYYTNPVAAANIADYGKKTYQLYENMWGKLNNPSSIAVIETEAGSGAQSSEEGVLIPSDDFTDIRRLDQMYHEISHLWNVRGVEEKGSSPRWNEGLSMFCQYLADEKLDPEKKNLIIDATNNRINWMIDLANKNAGFRNTPMIEFGNKQMTDHSYVQGMVMFSVLYYWLGENKFNQVIGDFYNTYYATGGSTKQFIECWKKTGKQKK